MSKSQFKAEHPFEKRREVAEKIRSRYSDRIPVIVEKGPKSDVPDIDKKKFLVPQNITLAAFQYEIRKHMTKLQPEKAFFLFVNDIVPPSSALMSDIYEKYKDEDGFLYVTYSGESTFGSSH